MNRGDVNRHGRCGAERNDGQLSLTRGSRTSHDGPLSGGQPSGQPRGSAHIGMQLTGSPIGRQVARRDGTNTRITATSQYLDTFYKEAKTAPRFN